MGDFLGGRFEGFVFVLLFLRRCHGWTFTGRDGNFLLLTLCLADQRLYRYYALNGIMGELIFLITAL